MFNGNQLQTLSEIFDVLNKNNAYSVRFDTNACSEQNKISIFMPYDKFLESVVSPNTFHLDTEYQHFFYEIHCSNFALRINTIIDKEGDIDILLDKLQEKFYNLSLAFVLNIPKDEVYFTFSDEILSTIDMSRTIEDKSGKKYVPDDNE
jgi:hypothetical protein